MHGEFAPKRVDLKVDPRRKAKKTDIAQQRTLPIIAVDPGGVTGWSVLQIPLREGIFELPLEQILELSAKTWVHGQIDCKNIDVGARVLRDLVDQYPHAAVVFESFFIRQMAVDLAPVELISIVRHHLWLKNRVMHMQQPAMAKALNDDRLKHAKVYTSVGGLQHARDADRHALMALRRCMEGRKGEEMQKKLWPHVFSES